MFNRRACENTRPDGVGVLEVVPADDVRAGFVPLKRTDLHGEIAGPLAALRLIQTFGYTSAQYPHVVEAVYRFPLPGDAAVTSVRVRFGTVDIRAELKERGQAEQDYAEAKRAGRQAALATREWPDVFTLQVAGIRPDEEVHVETSYVQLARPEGPGWTLRVPLTTSPRYVRADELASRHAQGQPLCLLRDPGHRFTLDLTLPDAGSATSPTHRLDVSRQGRGVRVRLAEGEVLPDRDCVLSWQPAQARERPALHVWLHDDRVSGQVYFLALVAPPALHDPGRGTPREVVLLVDHSGSMSGAKWQAADWAVELFLSSLTERDAFALGVFHNTTTWMPGSVHSAGPEAVEEAVEFLKSHRDSGGTELGVALEKALHLKRGKGEYARHALVITDAEVSDASRILRLADAEWKRPDRRRISVLCIDAAPAAFLATELAERGGGTARFLTSDPAEEDIATALDEVLADWAEPVLSGLRLEVDRPRAEAAGREVTQGSAGGSAVDLGDLPAGRPVWVAGRVPRGELPTLAFRVTVGGKQEIAAVQLDLAQAADARPALKALFGARRVVGLEFLTQRPSAPEELREQLRRLGYDPATAAAGKSDKVYTENAREETVQGVRQLLVREALDYGLASAETAFVAVRTEAGRPVAATVAVANALPAGWSPAFLGAAGAGAVLCALSAATSAGGHTLSRGPMRARGKARGVASRAAGAFKSVVSAPLPEAAASPARVVFSGRPIFTDARAVLLDSSGDGAAVPDRGTIDGLEVRFPDGAPAKLDPGLALWVYVGDLSSPRARVRLADVVRQRGRRPLNLAKATSEVLRVVLVDPAGAWRQEAPRVELALGWQSA